MWGQTFAGVIGGLPLAFFIAAIFSSLLPTDLSTKVAVAGALALPLWACTISAAYATDRGWRAWRGIVVANVACGGTLYIMSHLGLYGLPEILQ